MPSDVLSPDVLSLIARLKGRIPEGFRPREWVVRTPAGEHPVPPPVQTFLALVWPPWQRLATDDEYGWEVHLPAHGEVEAGLVEEETPRAWYAIGHHEGQWYLLVDLAEADDDFHVHWVDHEGGDRVGAGGRRLSTVLAELRVVTDHFDFPRAGPRPSGDETGIDAHTLVHADPDELLPLLDDVTSAGGRLAAGVYRTSADRHRGSNLATRRQLLTMDAARWGASDLARAIAAVPVTDAPADTWTVDWATGARLDVRVRARFDVGGSQVTAVVQGRPVLVTLDGSTLHVHDLATGAVVVEARLKSKQGFKALAVTESDGRWIAVTGAECTGWCDDDGCGGDCGGLVQRWNLADGTPIGEPLTGHLGSVQAVAVAVVAGEQVIVSGGGDRTLRMWDLRTGAPLGTPAAEPPDIDEPGAIAAIAVGEAGGRPIAITGTSGGTGLVWDLESGGTPGPALTTDDPDRVDAWISSAAISRLDGRPTVVTSGDDEVRLWDPLTGKQIGDAIGDGCVTSAVAEIDGRGVIVTASYRGVISAWDPRDRRVVRGPVPVFADSGGLVDSLTTAVVSGRLVALVGTYKHTFVVDLNAAPDTVRGTRGQGPRRGHTDQILDVASGETDSGAYLVTGGDDGSARVWDPVDGTELCAPLTGHSGRVEGVAAARVGDRAAAVTADDEKLQVWDPFTGELMRTVSVGESEYGHEVLRMSATEHGGRAVGLTAGYDGRVLGWDLDDGAPAGLPPLTGHADYIGAVLPVTVGGRRVVAVDDGDTVRIWDLESGGTTRALRHESGVQHMAVIASPVRPLVLTSLHDTLHVWDPATGEHMGSVDTGVTVCAMSAAEIDGRPLVATGSSGRTVRLWDAMTCRQVGSTLTVPEEIGAVALTPGGRLAVAFGPDIALLSRGVVSSGAWGGA
ncbi:WD40 repeat domain-containing protein [Streptomyces sp. NPDC051018]|uniref:WD40 repeat domain-containing protein n=1 Tax=Streptomyces sp. NPDC051018 TaxID=3365639 RepID=UPI0037AD1AAB